eukprot:TRINITY_DN101744_c0_g1_i1.p1 TRINITY_DN101744_c0_g1~~TRINITY_DN101744_c0_g1_i1.p1  ORF type:complete len:456 (-),score=90.71 TRINITY_DN101744_c0_g1_i1:53-1420(-)
MASQCGETVNGDVAKARKRPPIGRLHLLGVMVGLVLLGGVNFVLLKVLYTAYGDKRAFFVNQAINLLYIVYGGLILYPRMMFTKHVTAEMRRFNKRPFVIMGILDSLGTFFTCLGTAYTPGSITPILNQLLIPFTVIVSTVYMKVRPGPKEMSGAGLIIFGACLSVVPTLLHEDDARDDIRWYAVVFYAMSNVPMAMSACYKESTFDDETLDVWYLTQWVSIFQFLVSFLYMPLLVLPGFSSKEGMKLSEVSAAFVDGYSCFRHEVPECAEKNAFFLLTGYCLVNVCFNTLGLYLTKHGSAVLNALSFSILLPFTACLFFTPILGAYQEPFTESSWFTVVGLSCGLVGFAVYQRASTAVGHETKRRKGSLEEQLLAATIPEDKIMRQDEEVLCGPNVAQCLPIDQVLAEPGAEHFQPSFQERVIGLSARHPELPTKRTSKEQNEDNSRPPSRQVS